MRLTLIITLLTMLATFSASASPRMLECVLNDKASVNINGSLTTTKLVDQRVLFDMEYYTLWTHTGEKRQYNHMQGPSSTSDLVVLRVFQNQLPDHLDTIRINIQLDSPTIMWLDQDTVYSGLCSTFGG